MNRLREIAAELAEVGKHKTDLSLRLSHQRDDLAARQLALIPPEGWPGKNAEERKINEQRAHAADETCCAIQTAVKRVEAELAGAEHLLQTLVDERRALEWQIRARLVDAVIGHVITTNGNGRGNDARVLEDTAFDDFADDLADARLIEKFSEPYPPEDDPTMMTTFYDRRIAAEEDIPF
jgi:hypothetical protein